MPLDRAHVTTASRVMLPTYVGLFAGLGVNYLLSGDRLTESPALAYADSVLPLPVWGVVFLAVAVLMAAALATRRRMLYRYALWVAIWCMGTWAVVFVLAALITPASPGAFLWPAFAATCCYASNRSLIRGEV